MTMMQHNIKHLAVADTEGRVVGLVTNRDLLTAQGQSPFFLIREIMAADTVEAIFDMHGRLPRLIQSLINSGAKAMNITRFITTISDAITKRIIEFALEKCGPPPVPFVFMILGSEGRQEQTLKTDQDNAIVYEDVAAEQEAETQAYFLKLAKKHLHLARQGRLRLLRGQRHGSKPPVVRQPDQVEKLFQLLDSRRRARRPASGQHIFRFPGRLRRDAPDRRTAAVFSSSPWPAGPVFSATSPRTPSTSNRRWAFSATSWWPPRASTATPSTSKAP